MSQPRRNPLAASIVLTALICALHFPAAAKTTSTSSSSSSTTTAAPAATTSSTKTTTAPAARTDTPASAAATTTATPATKATGPVRAKLIDVDDLATSSLSKGSIDITMTLTDKGKLDDALVGAETPLSDKIDLITIANKKETVAPAIHVDLPVGKAVKLESGDKFLRISGIEKSLKDGDHFQLLLHFRSAPNVPIDVTVHKKSSLFGF